MIGSKNGLTTPCLFEISAYFVLLTLPISGGVWLIRTLVAFI
jgi:hypothetical protein